MLAKVKKTIFDYKMLDLCKSGRIIIALSGGADSVSLLYVLNMLIKSGELKTDIKLEACHLNHNLRGEESDRDEDFVRELCREIGIPLTVRSVNIKELAALNKHVSIEECARNERYLFFNEIGNDACIATAHNANDNCETVLLNIIRGTALKGLCGIPPVRDNIIRPLINVTRAEIETFCSEYGLKYVIDSTNFSDDYTRNKLRLNIIPQLVEINPSFAESIGRMCPVLREDESFLSDLANDIRQSCLTKKGRYDVSILINQTSPVLSRIISAILTQNNISPSALRINGIEKILHSGKGKINLVKNKFAVVSKNEFYLENIHQNYRKKS